MASTGFFSSFLVGVIVLILGEIFLTPLSLMLGSTPTILPYTEDYMQVILLGAPFLTSSLTFKQPDAIARKRQFCDVWYCDRCYIERSS